MLYIFDKDGTLVGGPDGRPPNAPDEQYVLPGVVEKLSALRNAGHEIAVATNQGGVAYGFMTVDQARSVVEDAAEKVGGVDAWAFCPFHPGAAGVDGANERFAEDSSNRKPNPGMIISLSEIVGYELDSVLFVGDHESDRMAAHYAGVEFEWAREFFGW